MARPKKENLHKKRLCSCQWWKECSEINQAFRDEGDDLRGGDSIRLDLSGESESKSNWMKGVVKKLNIDLKTITNLKQVPVMRHHWTVQQLNLFFTQKKFPSTLMKLSEINKIAHIVDRDLLIKRKNSTYFYNLPK